MGLLLPEITSTFTTMAGYVKTFVELYPDKEPDEIKLTVKVIE